MITPHSIQDSLFAGPDRARIIQSVFSLLIREICRECSGKRIYRLGGSPNSTVFLVISMRSADSVSVQALTAS